MNDQHSPGRMTVHAEDAAGWPLLMIGSRIVANVNPESGVDTSKAPSIAFKKMPAEANARRLAACWNYCEGLDTDGMETATKIGQPIKAFIDEALVKELELIAQRDELLAALQRAIDEAVADGMDDWHANAKAAIARFKG